MSIHLYEETVNLKNKSEYQEIQKFLANHNLTFDPVTYTVRILNESQELVGTGSVQGDVVKCLAVRADCQREGVVFAKLVSHLLEYLHLKHIHHCFVFTRPEKTESFQHLGFKEIARVEPLIALLETGQPDLEDYKEYLRAHKRQSPNIGGIGVCIVNCNPFTLGHRYLIETAAQQCSYLYVIAVEEDLSVFPFKVRFDLIQKGTADLANVCVLEGGKYVISSATFPSYFLKNEDIGQIQQAQAELDVRIFAQHIASTLNITKRLVGTEDYCKTTAAYNAAMQKVLPEFGLSLEVIIRKKTSSELIISASHVRKALKTDDWPLIEKLVPKTTLAFLQSPEAKPIIEKLKKSDKRH
jgi:[citrate (pro-3S)-lyase] ligase